MAKTDKQLAAPAEPPLQADENSPASFSADAPAVTETAPAAEAAPPVETVPPAEDAPPAETSPPTEDAPQEEQPIACEVISPLHHDGKHYGVGRTVMLKAMHLLHLGHAVRRIEPDAAAKPPIDA